MPSQLVPAPRNHPHPTATGHSCCVWLPVSLQARFLGVYHSIHGDSRHMVKRKIDVSSGFTILPPDPFKSPRTLP